jgi:hypothetical protein
MLACAVGSCFARKPLRSAATRTTVQLLGILPQKMSDPVASAAADAVTGAGGLQALAASPAGIGALAVWDDMDGAPGRPSRGRPKGARNRPKDFLGLIPALIGERFGEMPGEEDKAKERGRKHQVSLSEDVALKREQIERALVRLRALLDEGEDIKEREQARLTGRVPLSRTWREGASLAGDATMLGDLSGAGGAASLAFTLGGSGLAGLEPSSKRRRLGDEDSVEVSALGGESSSSASAADAAGAGAGRTAHAPTVHGVLQQAHPQRCPIASGFATLYSLPSGTLLSVEFPGMSYAASSAAAAAGGAGVPGAGAGLLPGGGSAAFGGAGGSISASNGAACAAGPATGSTRSGSSAEVAAAAADVMSSAAVAALHNAFKRQ